MFHFFHFFTNQKNDLVVLMFLLISDTEEGRGHREKTINIDHLPPACTPTGNQTGNLAMCFDQESNGMTLIQMSHTSKGQNNVLYMTGARENLVTK